MGTHLPTEGGLNPLWERMASEATEAKLPFGMGSVDLTSTGAVFTIVSLILGFAVFSMTQSIGDYVGARANNALAGVIGVDPTSGEDTGADLV